MKHHWLVVALLAMTAAGCGTENDDVAAIRALGDRWLSAYITADREALAACFTEDAWVMARGRPKLTGRDAIVATLDNRPPALTIDVEVTEEEINVAGDLAWTVGTFSVTTDDPTDADPPRQSLGRAMLIYKKGADGQWRIHRDMDTPMPEPAGPAQPAANAANTELASALLRTAIVVSDLDRSRAFYESALGYRVRFDGDITRPTVIEQLGLDASQRVYFVILEGAKVVRGTAVEGAMIGLLHIQDPTPPVMTRPAGADLAVGENMLAVVTTDIETAYARMQAQGVKILLPPTPAPDGSESEMVVHDPDGIRVHVVQRHD